MANMNIGSANAGDAFYRYKMPKLEAKIEGRGNGIKTNVVNLVDISKCLGRPPQCTLQERTHAHMLTAWRGWRGHE